MEEYPCVVCGEDTGSDAMTWCSALCLQETHKGAVDEMYRFEYRQINGSEPAPVNTYEWRVQRGMLW